MKKIDIRKVYVCEILKQTEVIKMKDDRLVMGHDTYYKWDYEDETQFGLFVKVPLGYKHIVTDTVYPMPSKRTGNKHVINPKNMEKLVISERQISSHIVAKYGSYNIGVDVYAVLEEHINDNANFIDEGQDEKTM